MAHPDRNGGDQRASHKNRLRDLISPEVGLGRVSSEHFADVDGSTINAYVLPVPGTDVAILVREDRNHRWHTDSLHGKFDLAKGDEQDRLTRKVRQLGVVPTESYTDSQIGNHLAFMAEKARIYYPAPLRDYTRSG